ncbi:MAG: hypothetical protein EP298_05090 [Gammaproteobacteria bacterium]|nr:MAG: hypothetical protein EP298_05090 [Gammaproteobacteria bacterium]UTW42499.1 hypothetical protein KFE69_13665 [bacterium SCSIO 12844]
MILKLLKTTIKRENSADSYIRKSSQYLKTLILSLKWFCLFLFTRKRHLSQMIIAEKKLVLFYQNKQNKHYCMTIYRNGYQVLSNQLVKFFKGYRRVNKYIILSKQFIAKKSFTPQDIDLCLNLLSTNKLNDRHSQDISIQHGDLVPSNIMYYQDKLVLIDGDNVDYHPRNLDLVCLAIALAAGEPDRINEYEITHDNPYIQYLISQFEGDLTVKLKAISQLLEYKIQLHQINEADVANIWRRYLDVFNTINAQLPRLTITCFNLADKKNLLKPIIEHLLTYGHQITDDNKLSNYVLIDSMLQGRKLNYVELSKSILFLSHHKLIDLLSKFLTNKKLSIKEGLALCYYLMKFQLVEKRHLRKLNKIVVFEANHARVIKKLLAKEPLFINQSLESITQLHTYLITSLS